MQRLEVSGVVRLIYRSLGVKGLNSNAYMKGVVQYDIDFLNPLVRSTFLSLYVVRMILSDDCSHS